MMARSTTVRQADGAFRPGHQRESCDRAAPWLPSPLKLAVIRGMSVENVVPQQGEVLFYFRPKERIVLRENLRLQLSEVSLAQEVFR